MEAEALPLITILDLKEDIPQRIAPPAPAVSYSGNKHGMDIHVVRNGKAPLLSCMAQEGVPEDLISGVSHRSMIDVIVMLCEGSLGPIARHLYICVPLS